jgi:RNA polymerase sigma-70 factor (ECF subfamily)
MKTDDGSGDLVARWRTGDQQAAAELFRRYAHRLIALARSRLSTKLAGRIDPEDVVQSAYRSFFAGAAHDGRFDLERGGDIWRLLVAITLHKLNDQLKRNTSQKRSVAQERGFGSEDSLVALQAHLRSEEPSPIEAVALADEVERLMRGLEPAHRRMLELRLQGCNIFEIAAQVNSGERTVRRVLKRVKQLLEERPIENSRP